MKYFPVFLRLTNRPCLIVGGGDVAARKIAQLLKTGANITVVAPELCAAIERQFEPGEVNLIRSNYKPEHLAGHDLVIAATNDEAVNELISKQAQKQFIPVNVVDNPELCSFIVPSTIDRDPVQIAISTGGASPVLARLLRSRLETFIPAAYGRLATLMSNFREQVKHHFPKMKERRRFWEQVLNGPITEMFLAGQEKAGLDALEKQLESGSDAISQKGEVYLVGGGPGDPDLLTFRALRLMQQAEVVLFDRLISPKIVDLARRDAEFIYVGKKQDLHTVPQDEINELLVKYAKEGKRVLRLKGGDPFIFGRGGEEIEKLMEEGIPFQIVPGITAASGCASYSGIPLTHRDYAQTCIFVTGHMKDDKLDLNWDALVKPRQTIAIYMGVKGIDTLCEQLIKHGMDKTKPVALIEKGTMLDQKVYIETLAGLAQLVKSKSISPPSMIIIGDVVKLHEKLAWYQGSES